MPTQLLLNGPPASGKSTFAARLVDVRSLALNLDIDVIRSHLGGWLDHPREAGSTSRALALEMARTHLRSGHDVVVPQYLARVDFIEQLELFASSVRAAFVEVLSDPDHSTAIEMFETRRRCPASQVHLDAAALVDRSEDEDPLGALYDALQRIPELRPAMRRVRVRRGDVDATLGALVGALDDVGIAW